MRLPLHIGIDDTDSDQMGCTTYVASLLVEKLTERNIFFWDYPNLIRLNPNVPWKTRGNGAICIRIHVPVESIDEVIEDVVETVEINSDLDNRKTDPGIVFFFEELIPKELSDFSKKAEQEIVKQHTALKLIKRFKAEAFSFKQGRGIIGALAAIGETLSGDHTYELIAYRIESNRKTPRKLDEFSVFRMDEEMKGLTFNNVDYERRRVLITPRGPDPVLLAIRGESSQAVKRAYGLVKARENVERWVIFRTNQGTDAHLRRVNNINQIRPLHQVIVIGSLSQTPQIHGRHVIFNVYDDSGQIDCAAYEPTGKFRNVIKKLTMGDLIEAYGAVRPASERNPMTINLEKIRIINLVPIFSTRNPVCKLCQKHMESMGIGKGFRCKKCGLRERKAGKIKIQMKRSITEDLYIPPPRVNRHLTKPLSRYGLEKKYEKCIPKAFWGS